ncbi:hypothetical protein [Chlamydia pneumoniae]|uniref:hypothetical protein n=1 Tax=Chlamydia pneumoniae TaxID=83558 RepID=UPI00000CCD40|nr:hypothetical protein [Chlamydia pneumoniae]BAA99268.1 CT330 hypothetical protein [Chlamydia pneumoniae J138]
MVEIHHKDPSLKKLFALQQSLETLNSLSDIVATYEAMFSLIYEGLNKALRKDQLCYLLSGNSKGELLKSPSGDPIVQTFPIHPHH